MKRILAFLLLACVLLSLLVSCAPTQEQSENTSSEETSNETSDESSETSEVISADIQYATVVSVGKTYTKTIEADSKYPDSYGTELCDGLNASTASYMDDGFSGFIVKSTSLRVVFDMGDDYRQLYKFGISYLATYDAGIGPISTCRVFYSMDGETWQKTNFFTRPAMESGTIQTAWLELDTPVDAKYIRFDLKGESGWLFLDELIIIANTKGTAANSSYLESLKAKYGEQIQESSIFKTENLTVKQDYKYSVTDGKRYKTSENAVDPYLDDEDLLTDGQATGAKYDSGNYAGFDGSLGLDIDINLDETFENVSCFELSMYQRSTLNVLLPYYVDVYVSEDGTNYNLVGRVYATDDMNVTNFTFSLRTNCTYTCRKIRFSLPASESNVYLIEEAEAYVYGEDPSRQLYPTVVLDTSSEATEWPTQSKKEENLVAGLSYQIESTTILKYSAESAANTQADAGLLTDGQYSPNLVYDNGYWNQTRNGSARNIYFDLGYLSTITGFQAHYLNNPNYGILVPSRTTIKVSEDGIHWYQVGAATTASSTEYRAFSVSCTLSTPVIARYVMISFAVATHTYCDEIEITGMKTISSKASHPEDVGTDATNAYLAPSESLINGSADTVLIYHNIVDDTVDYFLPYVGYVDSDGTVMDTMFDSFLFLPSTSSLPSGGYAYASEDNPNHWNDWESLFSQLFTSGVGFDALNQAVGQVKEALSLSDDYKVSVFATIMYLESTCTDFGDCDGDGVNEDLSTLDGRLKVIQVYMDKVISAFNEAGYENLTLSGFYWFDESIDEAKDGTTISGFSSLANERGYQTIWIPYYHAKGYNSWASFGFATATMQPNYVFSLSTPYSQLVQADVDIKTYGMGVEIEICEQVLSNALYYKKYMQYLGYGTDGGYMTDCIHMYYQSSKVYYNAAYSSDAMARSVYDATYQFIKGTLTVPEQIDDISASVISGAVLSGQLIENSDSLLEAEITSSTEHGSVSVSPEGSYVYIPYEGYTGTDSFTFRYTNYLGWSDDITVTITVK